MKALVIFDTTFGNTRIIANAIASELGKGACALKVNEVSPEQYKGVDLLIVGSPIIGWKPAERMGQFLATLKADSLKGIKAATFDTRIKLFIHGDAAKKISAALEAAGSKIIATPECFYVRGTEGPLFHGEIEKAFRWAKLIKSTL